MSSGVSRELGQRGFRADKVITIHNPVQLNPAPASAVAPWQAALMAMGRGTVIITLGRLVPVKDHATLLGAFQLLCSRLDCRLVIFGEGPLDKQLKDQAAALGIADRVLFAGYAQEPAAAYAAADLFVLSSTSEGFGNVIVEAMSAGVPVVSTDAPYGPREILADGEFGELVPVGHPDALADAMERALTSPVDPATLKARAAEFGLVAIGDRYQALLLS